MGSDGVGHVGVIGGGISGLATAHQLTRAGARVTLFEASADLGGLGATFRYRDVSLERFYHCMLPTDRHLLSLLRYLGLEADTYWKPTSFGFMREGKLYGLNTPVELLRFAPLSVVDRLRVGATGVWGSLRSAQGLDDITCEAWLTALSGRRAFDTFWRPMLEAKFGDRYRDVPALWFWTRFNREKGAKTERKGYLRGGYRRIAETLGASLAARGATIHLEAPIARIDLAADGRPIVHRDGHAPQTFDRLVYTGPIALLPRLVDPARLGCSPQAIGEGIDMQGVVNAVLLLKRGFSKHYWVAAVDKDVPFQGIVESTTLIEPRDVGGAHLVYLMNYLHRTDPRFARDEDAILADYRAGLRRMFPDFSDDDILEARLFRAPHVEPLYTLGFGQRKPPIALVPGRVYLATTAQVYPKVTSWDGSTGLAYQVADQLLSEAKAA
jgi:protoporphyrinogen oxidase